MDDPLKFPTNKVLRSNLEINSCLDQAKIMDLEDVVIVGFTKEGNFFFSASGEISSERCLWLLKQGERYIFNDD